MVRSLLVLAVASICISLVTAEGLIPAKIDGSATVVLEHPLEHNHVTEHRELADRLAGLDERLHMNDDDVYNAPKSDALAEIDANLRMHEATTSKLSEMAGLEGQSLIQEGGQQQNKKGFFGGLLKKAGKSLLNKAKDAIKAKFSSATAPAPAAAAPAPAPAPAASSAPSELPSEKFKALSLPEPEMVPPPATSEDVATKYASLKSRMSNNIDNIDSHLNQILDEISKIQKDKRLFANEVMAGSATKFNPANLARTILGHPIAMFKPRERFVRSAKDVIDCTACRFTWLKCELDVGNSYSEKLLYDAFITACTEMQKSDMFFTACNDMFVQVDDMIGDYLNGYTVSQMCENARMCR